MMVDTVQLSESLQALIVSRLDTIDRMLLGRLSRQHRLAIVREVESQIHELLQECDTDELTREDVLAVLARLDPPEAYIPDEMEKAYIPDEMEPLIATSRLTSPFRTKSSARQADRRTAFVSGILGLATLALFFIYPALYVIALSQQSQFLALTFCGVTLAFAFPAGILGLVLGVYSRKSGAWAVVGIVACALTLLLSPLMILSCFI
jgi:VIT1/CCC1 family predicted Fe2+/Mn2+ transporter